MHPVSAGAEDSGAFEHRGWQEAAGRYEATFAALTAQSIEPLLDAVGAAAGTRLLDAASGPGHLAAAAAGRGVIATGLDCSPAMVARARAAHPQAEGLEHGTVRAAATLRMQTPAALARVRAALIQDARAWQGDDGSIELPMPALLACATRP